MHSQARIRLADLMFIFFRCYLLTQKLTYGRRNSCIPHWLISKVGTFPRTDSQISSKEHVEKPRNLVADVKSEAFSNNHMPGCSKSFIQSFLDHLGSRLIVIDVFFTG